MDMNLVCEIDPKRLCPSDINLVGETGFKGQSPSNINLVCETGFKGQSPLDDIFEQMLETATQASMAPTLTEIIDAVRQIEVPALQPKAESSLELIVDNFDQSMNLLNYEVREKFMREQISPETTILTFPELSTTTIYGQFTNVQMHEREWVQILEPSKYILELRSNFGSKVYERYIPPPRKIKKPKKGKERKKQGTGTEFHSQLTFVMNTNPEQYGDQDQVPTDQSVFKIKVFRNGKTQFPGKCPCHVDSIIRSMKHIEQVLNQTFHSQTVDISKRIHAISINICMKNYKFRIKKASKQVINLNALQEAFKNPFLLNQAEALQGIFEVSLNTTNSNLSIIFKTPTYMDKDKTLRLTIEKSGKVNIKGGLYIEHSAQIFGLLEYVIRHTPNSIISIYQPRNDELNVPQTLSNSEVIRLWSH